MYRSRGWPQGGRGSGKSLVCVVRGGYPFPTPTSDLQQLQLARAPPGPGVGKAPGQQGDVCPKAQVFGLSKGNRQPRGVVGTKLKVGNKRARPKQR